MRSDVFSISVPHTPPKSPRERGEVGHGVSGIYRKRSLFDRASQCHEPPTSTPVLNVVPVSSSTVLNLMWVIRM